MPGAFPLGVMESLDWVGAQVLALLAFGRNGLDAPRYDSIIILIIILITKGNIYVALFTCEVLVQALTPLPEVGITVIVPALHVRTVRCKEVRGLARGRNTRVWQTRN